jgi:hypothetical protein
MPPALGEAVGCVRVSKHREAARLRPLVRRDDQPRSLRIAIGRNSPRPEANRNPNESASRAVERVLPVGVDSGEVPWASYSSGFLDGHLIRFRIGT